MIKKVFKIIGMHCTACAMNIDGELEDAGVKSANTNYVKSITEVEFDEQKINNKQIIEIVKKLGYTASLME